MRSDDLGDLFGGPWVDLLNAGDQGVGAGLVASGERVHSDLARCEHEVGHLIGGRRVGVRQRLEERALGERAHGRAGGLGSKQRLRGEDHQRLANIALHLATKDVEEL